MTRLWHQFTEATLDAQIPAVACAVLTITWLVAVVL